MWQGSDAQNLCKEWYGKVFTQPEQNSIISVSKTDTAVNLYGINWAASSLSEDRLFFLSVQELAGYVGSYTYASILADTEIPYLKAHHDYQEESAADWWLRSPHLTDGNDVGFVNSYGFVDHYNASTLATSCFVKGVFSTFSHNKDGCNVICPVCISNSQYGFIAAS